MSSISTATFPSPIVKYEDPAAKIFELNVNSDLPKPVPIITLPSETFPSNIKTKFFETIASIKKVMKKFQAAIKVTERDFFPKSDTKSDLLKAISVATLPFIMIELCLKIKGVFEVFYGAPAKGLQSEKINAVCTFILGVGNNAYEIASSSIDFFKSIIKINSSAADAIKSKTSSLDLTKILGVTLLPFVLFGICKKIADIYKVVISKSIVQFKDKLSRVTDSALSIIGNCVDVTRTIASLVGNTAVTTVTGFLSAINIVVESKKTYDAIQFYRRIRSKQFSIHSESKYDIKRSLDPSDPIKCILGSAKAKQKDILLHEIKKNLSKRYSPKELLNKSEEIDRVAQNILKNITAERIFSVELVQKATKARSIQKITCSALKILASAVNVAASAILLAVPPLAPVTYGLLGISGLISLSAFLIDYIVGQKWEDAVVKVVNRIIDLEWKAQRSSIKSISMTPLISK